MRVENKVFANTLLISTILHLGTILILNRGMVRPALIRDKILRSEVKFELIDTARQVKEASFDEVKDSKYISDKNVLAKDQTKEVSIIDSPKVQGSSEIKDVENKIPAIVTASKKESIKHTI